MVRRSDAERTRDLERVADLSGKGLSERQIAREVGRSRPTVRKDLAELAVRAKPGGRRDRTGRISVSEDRTSVSVVRPKGKRALPARRLTIDNEYLSIGRHAMVVAPEDFDHNWRTVVFDRAALDRMRPSQLMETLITVSPPLSRAVWDFLRLLDPGHEYTAYKPGTEEPHEQGQAAVDAFQDTLRSHYGSLKVIHARLFMAAYLRGAFLAELVIAEDGRTAVDLATPDPMGIRFKRVEDPQRGVVWQMGQWQRGTFVPIDRETVKYIPVDPFPGKPYGRSPAAPALFPAMFLLGLFHDLRRVVAQQGYPRLDVSLSLEKLAAAFPRVFDKGGDDWEQLIDGSLDSIEDVWASLAPDDVFVHTDDQTVNRPVGALDTAAVASADTLIKALERSAVQAVKSMPLMLGITDGATESNSNRQWEILAAAVKSLQQDCETVLGDLYTIMLEAQGIQADVKVTFAEVRAAELDRDTRVERQRMENAAFAEDRGWLTPLEAATAGLDREPSPDVIEALEDEPPAKKPTQPPPGQQPDEPDETDDTVVEPGSDRARALVPEFLRAEAVVRKLIQDYGLPFVGRAETPESEDGDGNGGGEDPPEEEHDGSGA
jgi:hypothetical protein